MAIISVQQLVSLAGFYTWWWGLDPGALGALGALVLWYLVPCFRFCSCTGLLLVWLFHLLSFLRLTGGKAVAPSGQLCWTAPSLSAAGEKYVVLPCFTSLVIRVNRTLLA